MSKRRVKRVGQAMRIVTRRRGDYAVIYVDDFGQVRAYDTHGLLLATHLVHGADRQLRLSDILHRKAYEALDV